MAESSRVLDSPIFDSRFSDQRHHSYMYQVKYGGPLTQAGLPALLGVTIASRRGQPLIGIYGDPPDVYPLPRSLIGIPGLTFS